MVWKESGVVRETAVIGLWGPMRLARFMGLTIQLRVVSLKK